MSHICIMFALPLVRHVRINTVVIVSGAGSAVSELKNQSTLGIQKGGLKEMGAKEHFSQRVTTVILHWTI